MSGNNSNLSQNATEILNRVSDNPDPIVAASVAESKAAKAKAELDNYTQNMNERKRYAKYIFWLVAVWLFAIILIVASCGIKSFRFITLFNLSRLQRFSTDLTFHFELTETVIITLITTTTINVAGFFLVVIKYLFPSGHVESVSRDDS